MNILIYGEREIIIPAIDKQETQTKQVFVFQTPTEVSYEILESSDPIAVYCDYVLSVSEETTIDIYSVNDFFQECEPIGTETFHRGKDHIEELMQDIQSLKESGYKIKFDVR